MNKDNIQSNNNIPELQSPFEQLKEVDADANMYFAKYTSSIMDNLVIEKCDIIDNQYVKSKISKIDDVTKHTIIVFESVNETDHHRNVYKELHQIVDLVSYDILYLTDYVDEFCVTAIQEYDSKKFANVESEDLGLESDEEKEEVKKVNEESKDMLSAMLEIIGDDVKEVKLSKKLKSHPVCLTTKGDISIEMQKVFDAMPNDLGVKAEMILEVNEKHPISKKLKDLYESDKESFDKYTKILYSEAKMIAGLPIDNPTEISSLICEVISE